MDMGNFITIESVSSLQQSRFIGSISIGKEKFGHEVKTTIYARRKLRFAGIMQNINVKIDFIEIGDRDVLEALWENGIKINVIDENGEVYSNFSFLNERLDFETKYDVEGNEFYTTSFEVGT